MKTTEPNEAIERRRLLVTNRAFSVLRTGTIRAKQPSRSSWTLGRIIQMKNSPLLTQRDVMRLLNVRHNGDEHAIVQEYVKAELDGKVRRHSDASGISPEDYAKRLLYDGIKKGWL